MVIHHGYFCFNCAAIVLTEKLLFVVKWVLFCDFVTSWICVCLSIFGMWIRVTGNLSNLVQLCTFVLTEE